MAHRVFDAAAKEAEGEPITFSVGGYDHTFTVKQPLPLGQLVLFSRVVKGEPQEQAQGVDRLMRGWIIDEDREKWDECVGQLTNIEVLGEIVNYIAEEATGRPTQASSS